MAQDDMPKVVNGKLDRPYPIRSMADVHRARVLPPPRVTAPASPPPAGPKGTAPASAAGSKALEQPQSGFDYVKKRNELMREMRGTKPISSRRMTGSRSMSRKA